MLALEDYEATLCPECGLPADQCHDPLMPNKWTTDIEICQTRFMREIAVSEWKHDHPGEPEEKLNAIITRIKPRTNATSQ